MANRMAYLEEAEKRGILPPEMQGALAEARKRGLVPPGRSYASGLARAFEQGATLSFGDEINAAARAGYQKLTGESDFGPAYEAALEDERAAYKDFSDENPVTSFAAGIAGGFVPALVAPGVTGVRFIQQAKNAGQAAKRGLAVGTGYGAVSGFGAGEGQSVGEGAANRLATAAVHAPVGAALGAAGGYVGHRLGEAIAGTRQAQTEVDPSSGAYNAAAKAMARDRIEPAKLREDMLPPAGRIVTQDMAADIARMTDDGLTQADIATRLKVTPATVGRYQQSFAERNQTPLTIVDRAALQGAGSGQNTQWTMRAAAATPGEARTQAAERLTERQVAQPSRLVDALQRYIGDGDVEGRIAQLQETVRGQERAAYDAARAAEQPFNLTATLRNWQRRINPRVQQGAVAGRASESNSDLAVTMNKAIAGFFDDVDVPNDIGTSFVRAQFPVRSLERFQQAKENLDDIIQNSFKDARPTNLTRHLQAFKKEVMGEVRKTNPEWAKANDLFADGRAADKALALGEQMAARMGQKSREALKAFEKMDPTQQELFRQGFSRNLQDRILNKREGADVTAELRLPAAKAIIKRVLERGPSPANLAGKERGAWNRARVQSRKDAQQLLRIIDEEAAGTRTFRALQGGSQTTPLKEAVADLNAPAYLTSALSYLNPRALSQELLSQVARRVYSGRNTALMEMLTETDPVKQMQVLEAIQRYSAARGAGGRAATGVAAPVTNAFIAETPRPGPDGYRDGSLHGRQTRGPYPQPVLPAPTDASPFPPPMRLGGPKPEDVPQSAQAQPRPVGDPRVQEAAIPPPGQARALDSYPPLRNFEPYAAEEARAYQPTPEDRARWSLTDMGMDPEQAQRAAAPIPFTPPGMAYEGGRQMGEGDVVGGGARVGLALAPSTMLRGAGAAASLPARYPTATGAAVGAGAYLAPGQAGAGEDTDRIKDLQTTLKNAGYYRGPIDGNMGSGTQEANQRYQADQLQRQKLEAARGATEAARAESDRKRQEAEQRAKERQEGADRLREMEENVPAYRRAWQEYGPLAAGVAGFVAGGKVRGSLGKKMGERATQRATRADATLAGRKGDVPSRVGKVNQFWEEGGAGKRVPFTAAPGTKQGYTPNPQAAPAAGLYQPGAVESWGPGATVAGAGALEWQAGEHFAVEPAREELEAAQAALSADPSEANIRRFMAARDVLAGAQGLANFGRGAMLGVVPAEAKARLTRAPARPNVSAAEAERLRLERLLTKNQRERVPARKPAQADAQPAAAAEVPATKPSKAPARKRKAANPTQATAAMVEDAIANSPRAQSAVQAGDIAGAARILSEETGESAATIGRALTYLFR